MYYQNILNGLFWKISLFWGFKNDSKDRICRTTYYSAFPLYPHLEATGYSLSFLYKVYYKCLLTAPYTHNVACIIYYYYYYVWLDCGLAVKEWTKSINPTLIRYLITLLVIILTVLEHKMPHLILWRYKCYYWSVCSCINIHPSGEYRFQNCIMKCNNSFCQNMQKPSVSHLDYVN